MKKRIFNLIIIVFTLLTVTSCGNGKIIPDGYSEKKSYTNADIGQLNNTLQLSIYKYDAKPNLSKNKFLEPITNNFQTLEDLLHIFENEIMKYDFKDKYDIKLEDINKEDYVYMDNRLEDKKQFSIYFFDSSKNTLYYCFMIVQDEVEEI